MCHTHTPPGQSTPDLPTDEVQISVGAGETMPATLVGAAGDPAVLVVGDVFGRSPFYEHLAALLAADGFQALLPDYFFRQGPLETAGDYPAAFARRARLDETRTLDDLRSAIDWLRQRSGQSVVGIVGFCMGGTFVLDLASSQDDLVAVAYYGFPVPPDALAFPPPRPIDLVDSLRGPVLAFWGEEDDAVGVEHARTYVERAHSIDPTFDAEILPGLGHGFLGSAPLGDPDDSGAATWIRAIRHLHTHLDRSDV